MGIFNIHLPIAGTEFNLIILIVIGFCVGVLGGFFGVGGGWIATPALNIFGFSMPFAIGTDLSHIFGKSIVATRRHSRMGHVDWKLGAISVIGSIIGIEVGKRVVLALERSGMADSVVRWIYIVLLLGLSVYMIRDYLRFGRLKQLTGEREAQPIRPEKPGTLAERLRRINLPPFISLPASGITRISFWIIFVVFLQTGFLAGLLGVGGGFILFPSLVYLIGCPTTIAVGTDLLSVCLMSGYGCFSYSVSGRTELVAALVMLIGAAVGAQLGALATAFVRGYFIRLLFAFMILFAGISVALKQSHELMENEFMGVLAAYFVLASAGGMSMLIVVNLLLRLRTGRADGGDYPGKGK